MYGLLCVQIARTSKRYLSFRLLSFKGKQQALNILYMPNSEQTDMLRCPIMNNTTMPTIVNISLT